MCDKSRSREQDFAAMGQSLLREFPPQSGDSKDDLPTREVAASLKTRFMDLCNEFIAKRVTKMTVRDTHWILDDEKPIGTGENGTVYAATRRSHQCCRPSSSAKRSPGKKEEAEPRSKSQERKIQATSSFSSSSLFNDDWPYAVKVGAISNKELSIALYAGAAGLGPAIHDAWRDSEEVAVTYMVMDRIKGSTVFQYLTRNKFLSVAETPASVVQAIWNLRRGLTQYHIDYRDDWHESNVLIDADGRRAYAIDFDTAEINFRSRPLLRLDATLGFEPDYPPDIHSEEKRIEAAEYKVSAAHSSEQLAIVRRFTEDMEPVRLLRDHISHLRVQDDAEYAAYDSFERTVLEEMAADSPLGYADPYVAALKQFDAPRIADTPEIRGMLEAVTLSKSLAEGRYDKSLSVLYADTKSRKAKLATEKNALAERIRLIDRERLAMVRNKIV